MAASMWLSMGACDGEAFGMSVLVGSNRALSTFSNVFAATPPSSLT